MTETENQTEIVLATTKPSSSFKDKFVYGIKILIRIILGYAVACICAAFLAGFGMGIYGFLTEVKVDIADILGLVLTITILGTPIIAVIALNISIITIPIAWFRKITRLTYYLWSAVFAYEIPMVLIMKSKEHSNGSILFFLYMFIPALAAGYIFWRIAGRHFLPKHKL